MNVLYGGIGLGIIFFSFFGGIALIYHGFSLVTINHYHYHNKDGDKFEDNR
jgi:hypothetical protein